MKRFRVSLFAAMTVALSVAPGWAADGAPDGDLGAVQRALESEKARSEELARKAKSLRKEAETARQERIRAARAIHDHEAKVGDLAADLMSLARREADAVARLADNRVRAARVVMALQRLARNPPEALLAQPLGPGDTVRSAILLRAAVPGIEARVTDLKADLDELAETRRTIVARRAEMDATTENLKAERKRLDSLFAAKKSAIASVEAERRKARDRLAALAAKAKNLRDLLARLEKDAAEQRRIERQRRQRAVKLTPPKAPAVAKAPDVPDTLAPSKPFSKMRGDLPFPAVGRVVKTFGEKTGAGFGRKGISLATLPEARVVAPYDGKVVYADRFRGYGLLLILDHGEGYHSLLAGMARIDGVLGQRVLAGEPVGVMGSRAGGTPELYVELRRDGQPINPMPWMAARQDKGKG